MNDIEYKRALLRGLGESEEHLEKLSISSLVNITKFPFLYQHYIFYHFFICVLI